MDGAAKSSLPRPSSKLPMPRSKQPPLHPDNGPVASSASRPNIAPTMSTTNTPRLAKRASSASLARPLHTAARDSATPAKSAVSSRTNLANGSVKASAPLAVASRAKQPQQQQLKRPTSVYARPSARPPDEEHKDRLGSLDGFRSASRQGLRSASYEEPVSEAQREDDCTTGDDARSVSLSSKPSLSDRTIGSIQSVPSTPKDRRRSSFFNPVESPMGPPPPRPSSSLSRNGSRPGTSDGGIGRPPSRSSLVAAKKAPTSSEPPSRLSSRVPSIPSTTPARRSISGGLTSKLQGAKASAAAASSSTPARKPTVPTPTSHKTRPPVGSKAIPTPSRSVGAKTIPARRSAPAKRAEEQSAPAPEPQTVQQTAPSNSSAALREQIAAARAAARKEKGAFIKRDSPQGFDTGEAEGKYEFDLNVDPFNQAPKDDKHILKNRIRTARMDGRLNIAGLGLKSIPEDVRKMYDAAAMAESKVNWAEVVDLSRLIAADNEFEHLDDDVFPDKSIHDLYSDDDGEGNQFGGLELLDLHGNSLRAVPIGLRRLERLTTLNLSHNALENSVLDILSQMKTLKDLRLGHNSLDGNIPSSLCDLPNLEVLDLQANKLLSLPEALRELKSLKVLNVSNNQLTTLPMEAIQQLPLTELDASSNALIMSFVPLGSSSSHPTLRLLNVSNNALAALTFSESLDMPQLRTLDVTNNHLTVLPPVSAWRELITLKAGDNKITDMPPGFSTLRKLRNVNFSSNSIRLIDPHIGRMEALESLILAANPLREKKFLTMSAADIKRDLNSRLSPEPMDYDDGDSQASPVTVIGKHDRRPATTHSRLTDDSEGPSAEEDDEDDGDGRRPSTISLTGIEVERRASAWKLKANGVLDLVGKNLSDDCSPILGAFFNSNEVKEMLLRSNRLTCIPPALWMGQDLKVLDLSDNVLSPDYLSAELELASLQELNLSKCRISSWEPLTSQLQAPKLKSLNIGTNRLSGALPKLRMKYPQLTSLFAHDNKISSISAEALRGMHAVNLTSNNIQQLPAEVGLLWDEGLKNLEIGSNAFRVPNYRQLDKGTESTLRWLRDRLPTSEGGSQDQA